MVEVGLFFERNLCKQPLAGRCGRIEVSENTTMKSISPLSFFAAGLLTVSTPAFSDELPEEALKAIEETVSTSVPHLVAALELATADGDDPKDFTALAKALTAKGLGKTPALPPWARDDESDHDHGGEEEKEGGEEEKVDDEHHKNEWKERVKRLGESDLKYLKGIDADQDLKTDGEEMATAIQGYLGFIIHDKLNVDGDGDNRLTLQEYALAVPAKGKVDKDGIDWHQRGHFEHDDENSDGYLDIPEMIGHDTEGIVKRAYLSHLVLILPEADKDEDGKLSAEEFSALSDSADEVWKEVSPEGSPVALSEIYPAFYWVPAEEIKAMLP